MAGAIALVAVAVAVAVAAVEHDAAVYLLLDRAAVCRPDLMVASGGARDGRLCA
jgi:hypothetical protein